jgi:hypothetical protein
MTHSFTQYLDVLDELIHRAEEVAALSEEMGRQAHSLLAQRVAQTLRDEVYSFNLSTGDFRSFAATAEQRGFVTRTTTTVEMLERVATLSPLVDLDDGEDDEGMDGDEEADD